MSDVSKTNELLVEAREHFERPGRPNINDGQGYCGRCSGNWPCLPVLLADALEAATRVPVQGEPNDDRTPEFEAIEQELFKHQPLLSMQDGSIRGCKCMDRVFVTKTEDWGTHLAEVFEQLSRATAPDAATGEGESRAWAIASHLEAERAFDDGADDMSDCCPDVQYGFERGAVWAAARVTPTREQIAKEIYEAHPNALYSWEELGDLDKMWPLRAANAVLALMTELAEGEDNGEHE